MVIINTITDKDFELNGIPFAKIYQPLKSGSEGIAIYSIYDTRQQIQNSIRYDQYQIDGVVYGSQTLTMAAILDVVISVISDFDIQLLQNRVSELEAVNSETRISNLENNQITGVETYAEFSNLPATGTLLTSYKVTNDTVSSSNNGYYHWDGAAYIKDAALVETVFDITNNSDAGSMKAIGDWVLDETNKNNPVIKIYGTNAFLEFDNDNENIVRFKATSGGNLEFRFGSSQFTWNYENDTEFVMTSNNYLVFDFSDNTVKIIAQGFFDAKEHINLLFFYSTQFIGGVLMSFYTEFLSNREDLRNRNQGAFSDVLIDNGGVIEFSILGKAGEITFNNGTITAYYNRVQNGASTNPISKVINGKSGLTMGVHALLVLDITLTGNDALRVVNRTTNFDEKIHIPLLSFSGEGGHLQHEYSTQVELKKNELRAPSYITFDAVTFPAINIIRMANSSYQFKTSFESRNVTVSSPLEFTIAHDNHLVLDLSTDTFLTVTDAAFRGSAFKYISLLYYLANDGITGGLWNILWEKKYLNTETQTHIDNQKRLTDTYMRNLSGQNNFIMAFNTDGHTATDKALKNLRFSSHPNFNSFLQCILDGGDNLLSGTQTKAEEIIKLQKLASIYTDYASKPVIATIGNHDDNSQTKEEARTINKSEQKQYIFDPLAAKWAGWVSGGAGTCYGYRDFSGNKVRVVVVDVVDIPYTATAGVNDFADEGTNNISETQLSWIANTALITPNDTWTVIISIHDRVYDNLDAPLSTYLSVGVKDSLDNIVNAYVNKTSGNESYVDGVHAGLFSYNVNYDFTGDGGRFAAYVHGHAHKDELRVSQNGFHDIGTADNFGFFTDGQTRLYTNESIMDIFILDTENRTIRAVRFGGGQQYNSSPLVLASRWLDVPLNY